MNLNHELFTKIFEKMMKKKNVSKIFQMKYIELPILEVFLIGAPNQNHLFFPNVSYKGRFL